MNGLFVGKRKVTAQVTRMALKLRLFYLSQDPEQLGPKQCFIHAEPSRTGLGKASKCPCLTREASLEGQTDGHTDRTRTWLLGHTGHWPPTFPCKLTAKAASPEVLPLYPSHVEFPKNSLLPFTVAIPGEHKCTQESGRKRKDGRPWPSGKQWSGQGVCSVQLGVTTQEGDTSVAGFSSSPCNETASWV